MVVKETNLLLFYFLYDRYFLKWFQIECQRNWWEAECIQRRRWRITHGSRDCSKKVTSVGSLVGSSFMFRGGRDGEQRGCPVVTLSDIIVFTRGPTKHALNFRERYSLDGKSTTSHSTWRSLLSWLQTHHCITVYSLSPLPPLILPSSSRLVPKARFKRRATREL